MGDFDKMSLENICKYLREKNVKYLRIKKRWLLAIESNQKTVEYRSCIPFYEWLSHTKPPFLICFHYQTDHRVIRTVVKIQKIKRPKWIDPKIIPTNECWAIHLKK